MLILQTVANAAEIKLTTITVSSECSANISIMTVTVTVTVTVTKTTIIEFVKIFSSTSKKCSYLT